MLQSIAQEVLGDLLHNGVLVYIDDVILFTKTIDEHFELLGFVVTPEGILIDTDKSVSINEFPVPKDQKQIKSFLGCCNFYRRYIKNFATRALPLTNLLRKDTPFRWTSETQEEFDDIKKAILNPPVLALPDQNADLQITTDASSRGIGAVLEQKYPNSEVKPLYFFSKELNPSQSKYTAGQLLRTDNTIIHSNHKMKGSKMWKIRISAGYYKKEQAHHSSAGGKSVSCCLRKADLPKNCCQTFEGRGLYARRPVVCIPLTRQHRTTRLQWCREHHNWTEQDWAWVLFSDESRFSLSSDCRRQLIWRESGTAYRPENIQEKDRYPTCSIMVWAGIMINGGTRLHVVANGTMTGQRYIDEVLLPHVRLFRGAVGDKFVLWTTTQHVIEHSLFRIV
ncbi:retrovirus-related Pol polyprotein from transposon 17.6 [Trichonephila clavipes]|nr:retrovirus-related Pol polyprotein from transposon 17.6 [Trichonephila clavipes]